MDAESGDDLDWLDTEERGAEQPPGAEIGPNDIAGHYIVQMREGGNSMAAAAAVQASPGRVYGRALSGFSARLNRGQVLALEQRPDVVSVEPDQIVTTMEILDQNTAQSDLWGLDRIDQRDLDDPELDGIYRYERTGANVHVYVLDTGIHVDHPDFGGRATLAHDVFGGTGDDCHGHGTHVAGTIGSTTYGVAKGVQLHAVRVLGCNGSGTLSGVIAGLEWVMANHAELSIVNMSLGAGSSSALDTAVNNLANSGVPVIVAAGNDRKTACSVSPAGAEQAFAVAASDGDDKRANFSNFGSCVRAYAPGVSILSTSRTGGTARLSGTSMASPHVAGVAALHLEALALATEDPKQVSSNVYAYLEGCASIDKITANRPQTPNLLIYSLCSSSP